MMSTVGQRERAARERVRRREGGIIWHTQGPGKSLSVEQAVLGLGKRAHTARLSLNLFYRKPIINAADLEQALSITTPTANALIKALVELGILKEITGQQRWRSYAFERYLSLFLS
jgi:hypothetical protein